MEAECTGHPIEHLRLGGEGEIDGEIDGGSWHRI